MHSADHTEQVTVVPELIRAANGAGDQSLSAIRRLLQRAVVEIRDLREFVGIPGSGTSRDGIIGIMSVAARVESVSDDDARAALLEAADMIRTLRIVAESGVELNLRVLDPRQDEASN